MTFTTKTEYLEDLSEEILNDIRDEDYIVVLNKDGMIKTIIAPDDVMSDSLKESLSYFGIYDLENITVH